MNVEQIEKAAEEAQMIFDDRLFEIAENAFNEHVKPFCEKRGWAFLAGNGTYCFFDENGDAVWAEDLILDNDDDEEGHYDEEFQEIDEICRVIVDRNHDLGSLMPSHENKKATGYHGETK